MSQETLEKLTSIGVQAADVSKAERVLHKLKMPGGRNENFLS